MASEDILKTATNGMSVLIEGSIKSKKEMLAYNLLESGLADGGKVRVFSFNATPSTMYLRQKRPETQQLVSSVEVDDSLTDLGINISKAIAEDIKMIFSDNFAILVSKYPPESVLAAYNFNLKKIRDRATLFIELVDPVSLAPGTLSNLESFFDIVLQVEFHDKSFHYMFRKHPTQDTDTEYVLESADFSVSASTAADFYKEALTMELSNVSHYARHLDALDEEERNVLYALALQSIQHASIFLGLIHDTGHATLLDPAKRVEILEEGLKEERMLKEAYQKLADELKDNHAVEAISHSEQLHEEAVLRLLARLKQ